MDDAGVLALENARLLEDLRAMSALKTEFIGSMSHELRSPLHAIIGYSEMLADGCEESGVEVVRERRDMLGRVKTYSAELLEMVEATLAVGRFESTRLPVTISTVALASVFAEVQAAIPNDWRKPGVTLEWRVGVLPVAAIDVGKLKMVVRNLVHNALKFTDAGTVIVEVSLEVAAKARGPERARPAVCRIAVIDTGIGIAADVRPVIFEMYRQGDASFTRRHGGVGPGLYIVKRMLEGLGSDVAVDSEVGRGTRFDLRIPLALPATAAEAAALTA